MRICFCFVSIVGLWLSSCANSPETDQKGDDTSGSLEVKKPEFQSIINDNQVKGSVLIYDMELDTYYSNDFDWANRGFLPASTFKIANSMIALDLGVVENDSTISYWDGTEKWLPQWEQDLILRDAFHFSCVPCYQEIARNIGHQRMRTYLDKMNYGAIDVDSTNIDMFWLEGDSRISQMQEIDFLSRFYNQKLPITDRTYDIMKRMIIAENNEKYTLSAKSGLSNVNGKYNGWYVGYLESNDKVYFFATNLEPQESFEFKTFISKRKKITLEAFKSLKIM